MKHNPMDFEEMDRLFRYESETGDIFNKIDRGNGGRFKAGEIATSRSGTGYLRVQVTKDGHRVGYLAHRVAWLLYYGVDPGEKEIDHIDGNKMNCQISNLRLVNSQENSMNRRKRSDNTSGVMGVSWHKRNCKWQAYISKDGKILPLGLFDDKFEAICVRKSAERRYEYHENHGK